MHVVGNQQPTVSLRADIGVAEPVRPIASSVSAWGCAPLAALVFSIERGTPRPVPAPVWLAGAEKDDTAMRHAGCLGRYDFVAHANFMSPKPTYKMETRHGACGYSGQAWLVHLGEQDEAAPDQWAVVSGNIVSGEGLVQHLGVRSRANSPAHIRDTWQVFDRGVQQEGTTTIRALDHEPQGFLVTKPRKPVPPARQQSLQHQLHALAQPQQRPAGLPLRSIDDAAESSVRPVGHCTTGCGCCVPHHQHSIFYGTAAQRRGSNGDCGISQHQQWPSHAATGADTGCLLATHVQVDQPPSHASSTPKGGEEIAFDEDDNDQDVNARNRAGRAPAAVAGALRRSVSTTAATLQTRAIGGIAARCSRNVGSWPGCRRDE